MVFSGTLAWFTEKSKPVIHIYLILPWCTGDSWTKVSAADRKNHGPWELHYHAPLRKSIELLGTGKERDKQYILSLWKVPLPCFQQVLMWFYALQVKGAFHILGEFQGALSAYLKRRWKNILIVLAAWSGSNKTSLAEFSAYLACELLCFFSPARWTMHSACRIIYHQ